jgi:hypothetical protein
MKISNNYYDHSKYSLSKIKYSRIIIRFRVNI